MDMNYTKNDICAIVVLYNPSLSILKMNMEAMQKSVGKAYLVDNSDHELPPCELYGFENFTYIPNHDNLGIAKALNIGVSRAADDGFKLAITMDQDSTFPEGFVSRALDYYNRADDKVAIVAPNMLQFEGATKTSEASCAETTLDYALTSGSLMRIDAYQQVGGFKDFLFIDGVDMELCYNLRKSGFLIIRLNDAFMQHSLGNNAKEIKLFGLYLFSVLNENYIRYYYIYRNYLYLSSIYNQDPVNERWNLTGSLVKTFFKMLFFEPDKTRKIKSIFRGIKDYSSNKFGRISSEYL